MTGGAGDLQLSSEVLAGLAEVESTMEARLRATSGRIASAALETAAAGGKRLRPTLVLVCGSGAGDPTRLRLAAAAVEFIHTASLVHDDILDEATTRRGRPTVNGLMGTRAATETGNLLLGLAFQMLAELDDVEVMQEACRTIVALTMGELHQRAAVFDAGVSEADYLVRVEEKTATLISVCCRIGALLAGLPVGETNTLSLFGTELGLAFQIYDDILDIAGDSQELGKVVGTDIREGMVTLPMIYALRDDQVAARLTDLITRRDATDAEVTEAIGLMESSGGLEAARRKARSLADRAAVRAEGLGSQETRRQLMDMAKFVVARYH